MTNFTKIRFGALGLLLCLMSSCSNSNFSQLQKSNELTIVAAEEPVKIEKIEVVPSEAAEPEATSVAVAPREVDLKAENTEKTLKKHNHLKTAKKLAVAGVKTITAPVAIAKKVTVSAKEKKASALEGNLRMAIIFAFIAIIFYILARFTLGWVFDLIGTIFLIVALLFFLFWVLEYA